METTDYFGLINKPGPGCTSSTICGDIRWLDGPPITCITK